MTFNMNDYKDTAFRASQMLSMLTSFAHRNKSVDLGVTEKEMVKMAEELMDDVRSLYKENV